MKYKWGAPLGLLLLSVAADAENKNTVFFGDCDVLGGTCSAYMKGFEFGIMTDQKAIELGTPICIPDGTSNYQIQTAVTAFIKAHPGVLDAGPDADGNVITGYAIMHAFPCKKSN